jgi:hypothetical protein
VSFPFDLHSAAVFDSHMPCRSPAMPLMCLSVSDLLRPWQGDGMLTASLQLASLCPLLLPRPVPGSLLSEAYQSQIAVASVKRSGVCDGRGEAYYFGARTWVLWTAWYVWIGPYCHKSCSPRVRHVHSHGCDMIDALLVFNYNYITNYYIIL